MMNGLVIKRGDLYLARKQCSTSKPDGAGNCWSVEIQAARVYQSYALARKRAKECGGVVRTMADGRLKD